jgi:hypothetical protein
VGVTLQSGSREAAQGGSVLALGVGQPHRGERLGQVQCRRPRSARRRRGIPVVFSEADPGSERLLFCAFSVATPQFASEKGCSLKRSLPLCDPETALPTSSGRLLPLLKLSSAGRKATPPLRFRHSGIRSSPGASASASYGAALTGRTTTAKTSPLIEIRQSRRAYFACGTDRDVVGVGLGQ